VSREAGTGRECGADPLEIGAQGVRERLRSRGLDDELLGLEHRPRPVRSAPVDAGPPGHHMAGHEHQHQRHERSREGDPERQRAILAARRCYFESAW
jgi:hypothetical protein